MNNLERMDRRYLWRARKRGHRVHIENPETERAYCQAENCSGGKLFDGKGAEVPSGRRICGNCTDLAKRDRADYPEPILAVLMGERIAEAEPESLASPSPPKPWKWGNQAAPSYRPRGREPKRSTVKHPRPFDDPLPW